MNATTRSTAKPKLPRGKRGAKPHDETENQATTKEFQEEGLGVAAKE